MVYDGPPSLYLPEITRAMVERLQANYRCLYLNSPSMVAELRSSLAASGVDVVHEIDRGALILSSEQEHLVDGEFDVEQMLSKLANALEEAQAGGFAGLWASGDMLWEFGSERNLSKLLAYEVGLEELLERKPGLCGICQYHRATLPATAVQVALYTHQAVYVNQTLSLVNPHYRHLATLRAEPGQADRLVEEMMSQME